MLKIFVVGEHSPDPDDWGGDHYIVVAESAEQAERLAMDSPAMEIPMDRPLVLAHENTGYSDE